MMVIVNGGVVVMGVDVIVMMVLILMVVVMAILVLVTTCSFHDCNVTVGRWPPGSRILPIVQSAVYNR